MMPKSSAKGPEERQLFRSRGSKELKTTISQIRRDVNPFSATMKHGDTCYLANGQECVYVGQSANSFEHIVQAIVERDDREPYFSDVIEVAQVFESVPLPKLNAEVAAEPPQSEVAILVNRAWDLANEVDRCYSAATQAFARYVRALRDNNMRKIDEESAAYVALQHQGFVALMRLKDLAIYGPSMGVTK